MLVKQVHRLPNLVQPTEIDLFGLWHSHYDSQSRPSKILKWSEAVQLAGGAEPRWNSLVPIRDLKKTLESPLRMETGPRSTRIMGFIDIQLQYQIPGPIHLSNYSNGNISWGSISEVWHMLIEVKSRWPSAGNLLRQLNLYRDCITGAHIKRVVVGPDESMNDLLCAHGWRLVTFNRDLSAFQLIPSAAGQKPARLSPNEF